MSKFAPHRRGVNNPSATSSTVCQKCLGRGHFTYECKGSRPYVSRPSRTQLLEKPSLLAKLKQEGKPSVEIPEEFKTKSGTANKILEEKEKQRAKEKGKEKDDKPPRKKSRRHVYILFCLFLPDIDLICFFRSRSGSPSSSSDSDSSGSDSDSDSGSSSGSESESDSRSESSRSRSRSRSGDRNRKRRRRSPSSESSRSPRRVRD
ncbi:hypothetical protein M422DRAFT_41938 [Sphaerobolus stellatus SS14]|nr:hypothetical protein M422DRAFT_41938 [Sphaerobolus stellatus SS14]